MAPSTGSGQGLLLNTTDSDTINAPALVERVYHIPFVISALRVYEQGKASSSFITGGKIVLNSFSQNNDSPRLL